MAQELNTHRKHIWDPRLRDISLLEEDWERGAKEIPDAVIETARILLERIDESEKPLPHISPTLEGGVQLIWKNSPGSLVIDIRDGSDIEIINRPPSGDDEETYDVGNPDTAIGIIDGWDFGT